MSSTIEKEAAQNWLRHFDKFINTFESKTPRGEMEQIIIKQESNYNRFKPNL